MLVCNKGLEQMSNWPWSVMKYASEILVDFKHHLTLNDPYSFETLSEPPASKGQPNCSCWLTVSECWWSTFLSLRGGRFPRNETADLGYKYLDWQMSMLSHIYIYFNPGCSLSRPWLHPLHSPNLDLFASRHVIPFKPFKHLKRHGSSSWQWCEFIALQNA